MQTFSRFRQWLSGPPAVVNVSFPEEPLHLSGGQGFGFFPARAGLLLKKGRYEILRKLGRGQFSSTWLVLDRSQEKPSYYAVKILTTHSTKENQDSHLHELEVMKAIKELAQCPGTLSLPFFFDHFETEGPHGRHLCLVMGVLSSDISHFRCSAPSKRLRFQTVQNIIAQVLDALVALHAIGLIHTDLKPDNVLFSDDTAPKTIQKLLNESPLAVDGEFELCGTRYPIIRSQPVPHPFSWNDQLVVAELYSVRLIGFGHAQWVGRGPAARMMGEYSLCAPEVILGANFGTKVDVWALGCMTFELLTGCSLFNPQGSQTKRVEADHLSKMVGLMRETFSETLLSASRKRDEYFNQDGKLLRIEQSSSLSLEQAMIHCGLPQAEVFPAVEFIRACLHLNPEERSSAADLDAHPWLENAPNC